MSNIVEIFMTADDSWKPCPICGGTVRVKTKAFYDQVCENSEDHHSLVDVECPKCELKMTEYPKYPTAEDTRSYYDMMFDLYKKWNRREIA